MTGDGRLFVWTKLPRGEIALFGSSPPPQESLENTNDTSSRQTSDAKNAISAPWNVGKERGGWSQLLKGDLSFQSNSNSWKAEPHWQMCLSFFLTPICLALSTDGYCTHNVTKIPNRGSCIFKCHHTITAALKDVFHYFSSDEEFMQ